LNLLLYVHVPRYYYLTAACLPACQQIDSRVLSEDAEKLEFFPHLSLKFVLCMKLTDYAGERKSASERRRAKLDYMEFLKNGSSGRSNLDGWKWKPSEE
jgi:hypothetical protein